MFRVILACVGLPPEAGGEAAIDIARDFADHRQWHQRVRCQWDGTILTLQVENDFDNTGLATLDEFSDCISAYVKDPGDSEIEIKSVREVDQDKAYYRVGLRGRGLRMVIDDQPGRYGFETARFVSAGDPEGAARAALDLVRRDPKLASAAGDLEVEIESIDVVLEAVPDVQPGFRFIPEAPTEDDAD